ncbi:MAG: hypothetical protein RR336_08345, partial [Oscillospiraceae bacterium]
MTAAEGAVRTADTNATAASASTSAAARAAAAAQAAANTIPEDQSAADAVTAAGDSAKAARGSSLAAAAAKTAADTALTATKAVLTDVTDPLTKRLLEKGKLELSPKEVRRMQKIKRGIVGKIMKKVKQFKLEPGDRTPPPLMEKSAGDILDIVAEKGFKDGLVSSVGSAVNAGTGIAEGLTNRAKGSAAMSYTNIGDKKYAGAEGYGDGSMQGKGVPILGVVLNAMQFIWDGIKMIMTIKDYIREHKAGGHNADERSEFIMEIVNRVLAAFDLANGVMGTFTTLLGTLPIVGAVLGTITNGIATVADIVHLVKAGRAKKRMKAQKALAKEALRAKADKLSGYVTKEQRTSRFRKRPLADKVRVTRNFGFVDEGFKHKKRTGRLDEIVVQLRDELAASAAGTPAAGTPAA